METQNSSIRIYGAGGCGLTLGSSAMSIYHDMINKGKVGISDISDAYIDVSTSNLCENHDVSKFYLVESDSKGSGAVRKTNYEVLSKAIKPFLVKYPPGDFNICFGSTAGGTGSVAIPLVARELLERGKSVICIMIGSTEALNRTKNTLETFKSLTKVSALQKKPLVVSYHENSPELSKRGETDQDVLSVFLSLCVLFSPKNSVIDSEDLKNWLDYTRSTPVPPSLSFFTTIERAVDIKDHGLNPISVVSLYRDSSDYRPFVDAPYYTDGVLPDGHKIPQIDFIIDNALPGTMFKKLEKIEERQTRALQAFSTPTNPIEVDLSDDCLL